jgi:tRNA(fMet)-specific endonuclease VapC
MFLIDSDRTIDFLKGRRDAYVLLSALEGPLYLSIVSYGEVYEGVLGSSDARSTEKAFSAFLRFVQVLNLTQSAMHEFARMRMALRLAGDTVSDTDLLIAATAVDARLTLVTRNLRDFGKVPGLRIL